MTLRPTKFVKSYFDAWNHGDSEGVADHLAADGVYRDVPLNTQQSHDELIGSLNDLFSDHRQHYELIGEILTGRDTIAFQYQMMSYEDGEDEGSPSIYSGAEFMTLNSTAALTITDYYDVPGVSRPSSPAQITSRRIREQKYAKSGLNDEQLLEYKCRLEQIMQSQQLFLSSDLTLPKLAKSVDCSINHLSQVINSGFGVSFFDYLNQYRIAHARELLSDFNGQSHAILNIAFTVGFNSNSAFYAAFKKCVGQTPAQYRKAQLRKPH
jgi:AraC-like DNA-binding protein